MCRNEVSKDSYTTSCVSIACADILLKYVWENVVPLYRGNQSATIYGRTQLFVWEKLATIKGYAHLNMDL